MTNVHTPFTQVEKAAGEAGLRLKERVRMPANNLLLHFVKE